MPRVSQNLPKCQGTTASGKPCQKQAVNGTGYCIWHGDKGTKKKQKRSIADGKAEAKIDAAVEAAIEEVGWAQIKERDGFARFIAGKLFGDHEKNKVSWARLFFDVMKEEWGLNQDRMIHVHFDSTMPEPVASEKED
jgi:hypothetical protein